MNVLVTCPYGTISKSLNSALPFGSFMFFAPCSRLFHRFAFLPSYLALYCNIDIQAATASIQLTFVFEVIPSSHVVPAYISKLQ